MSDFDAILARYDFALPDELIAQSPATPRDSARLAVLDGATGEVRFSVFRDIGKFLPARCVLVLNDTKVIPARLRLTRATGGEVEVLWIGTEGSLLRVMANRKLKPGEVLRATGDATGDAKGGSQEDGSQVAFTVEGPDDRYWLLGPMFPIEQLLDLLSAHGEVPLPPYIDRTPLTQAELKDRYQTVFATHTGSIAAPTASLHFTPELLASLEASGVEIVRVTLHVHLGTFARLTEAQWEKGELHRERYDITTASAAALESAKAARRPIVAVGTTVVRTLESAFDASGKCVRPSGETSIFLREGHVFSMADAMITNFHVPRSSLLMLVCAFAGYAPVMNLYRLSIAEKMRFYSFGDAMLLMRASPPRS